jgi:molybdate transport system ATP-binding protein
MAQPALGSLPVNEHAFRERPALEVSVRVPVAGFDVDVALRLAAPITVIMGPSGAGKTTLLESISGLRATASGRIALGERLLLDTSRRVCLPPEQRHVGYVPQDAGLFPHLSALANVRFALRTSEARLEGVLDLLDIRHVLDRPPVSLSGGERQRVALARALASDPDLLLLDEPLAAVDADLKERIVPYLLRLYGEWQLPILYVTHNAGEAVALGGEMVLLERGRVVAQGAPVELLSAAARVSATSVAGLENLLRGHVEVVDTPAGVTHVRTLSGQAVTTPLLADASPGREVLLAIRAEDVLLSVREPHGLSARNVIETRILSLHRAGHDVVVRAADPTGESWLAILTPAAIASLSLEAGMTVWLAVKSHSIRMV